MYILSVDQSTSSTKAVLIDDTCRVQGRVNKDHTQYYPTPGWVEHDPEEIFQNLLDATSTLIQTKEIKWEDIDALSITNQRETVVVWDKTTGKPVYNAIVWQCARAKEICDNLDCEETRDAVRSSTGLMLSPYFSAAKITWVLDNVDGARAKAEKGDLLAGTMESWLVWKLTNGKVHATDYSNASRTSLLNLSTLDWDTDICKIFNVPTSMLAEIKYSDVIWGETDFNGISTKQIPIAGILGDSHAALYAQQCFEPGMAKSTYGTGSSIMMNVGMSRVKDVEGLVSSIGWGTQNEVAYVLEGNINCTGATIKWLVDNMQILSSPAEAEAHANKVPDTGGVYLVPAFSGLSAPYWDTDVRAMIDGMSFSTTRSHIIRAGLEAIVYQITDIVELMTAGAGIHLSYLRTDGGPTKNKFLMQFQSDILSSTVVPALTEELSALGVAMLGGLAVGIWKERSEFDKFFNANDCFTPSISGEEREKLYNGWKSAVAKARKK